MPKKIKARHQNSSDCETYIELYIRSDGRVFDDEFEEVGQATQIDRPHGRAIDGDWAKYNLENYSDLPTKYLHMDLVREAIEEAPTILETEE